MNQAETDVATQGLFSGVEHEAFDFPGSGDIGALLIHGFAGTPSELRPLGLALAAHGISARGILLPGFGQDIGQLNATLPVDWMDTALHAWREMHQDFQYNVLIGFSLGGAIALRIASEHPPDRLILLSPLWRLMGRAWRLGFLLTAVGRIVPRFSPFASADFHHPHVRRFFERVSRNIDVDDPIVRAALRQNARIDTATIQRLWQFARQSEAYARRVTASTLVIQGASDQIVAASDTRALTALLPPETRLLVVPSDHLLIDTEQLAWPRVREAAIQFAKTTVDA